MPGLPDSGAKALQRQKSIEALQKLVKFSKKPPDDENGTGSGGGGGMTVVFETIQGMKVAKGITSVMAKGFLNLVEKAGSPKQEVDRFLKFAQDREAGQGQDRRGERDALSPDLQNSQRAAKDLGRSAQQGKGGPDLEI